MASIIFEMPKEKSCFRRSVTTCKSFETFGDGSREMTSELLDIAMAKWLRDFGFSNSEMARGKEKSFPH